MWPLIFLARAVAETPEQADRRRERRKSFWKGFFTVVTLEVSIYLIVLLYHNLHITWG
jgi:hypothetical protein